MSFCLILLGGLIETRSNIGLNIWITNTYENNYDGVVDGDGDEDDLMMRIVRTPIR